MSTSDTNIKTSKTTDEPPKTRQYKWGFGWLKRMYDWVLHWAETPYGIPALFLLAFAESSFFPIPPDVLLIALAVSIPARAFKFAMVCAAGSILGGIAGYGIGYFLWDPAGVSQIFFNYIPGFTPHVYEKVAESYNQHGFEIVFLAGFTPIPYKVITITAGVFQIQFWMFLIASAVSRSARFFLVATLFYFFGAGIKKWVDKYFEAVVLAFTVLLIGGFAAIKFLL